MSKKIIGYKGFNKDMTCKGFQYEEGQTYEMKEKPDICHNGFHFCEYPLDCFNYYDPNKSEYHEVECLGDTDRDNDDTKVCTNKIKIGAKIDIAGMVKASIDYTSERAKKVKGSTTKKKCGASSATGYKGASSATGECGASSATGYKGASSATGECGASSATGTCGASSATGYKGASSATGECGASLTTGRRGYSSTENKTAVAVAWGYEGRAKGVLGSYIVCAEWKYNDDKYEWEFIQAKMTQVDGKKIKENTYYQLIDGQFVEAEE